ncbi:MAG: two-component regulator propeller domain-containing protein [Bacteroidota bacterium]
MLNAVIPRSGCIAQNVIPRFENIGVNEGLSQSSVYSIFQDKQGFMWFGTAHGLNRFDGKKVQVYKLPVTTVANSNFIRGNICEDASGNIWFCNETGIFCFNRLKDALEIQLGFDIYNQSAGTFIDADDNFWIIHPITGIGVYNITKRQYRHYSLQFKINLQSFVWMHFMVDTSGNLLFRIQRKDGVYKFNTHSQTYEHALAGRDIYTMWMNGNEYCFLSDGKLIVLNNSMQLQRSDDFVAGKEIRNVVPDNYGRLWIATLDSGLMMYNKNNRQFTNYRHNNARLKSLPFDLTTNLYIDRADNLWIGSDGGGVSRLDLKPPRFNLFPLNEGDYTFLKDYFTRCFYEDDQQKIWFGTHNSGLNIFDPANGAVEHFEYNKDDKSSLPGNIVSTIFKDRNDQIWICGSRGISIFNEQEKKFAPVQVKDIEAFLNPYDVFVYSMIQLKNGDIIAATIYGLVQIKLHGNKYSGSLYTNKQFHGAVTSAIEMYDGSLWITMPLNGLKHVARNINSSKENEVFFKGIDLRSVHIDEKDSTMLWISSGNGLIHFNTISKKYKLYDEKDGMANSYVYGVLEDERHNFWISSNKGLIYFDRLLQRFINYDVNDGLQSNEFNTSAFYKSGSGKFYFGGVKGFNWFTSVDAPFTNTSPGTAITSVLINEKPFHLDSTANANRIIVLPYHQNSIALQFASLDYTRPEANRIGYQLKGWDNDEVISSEMNTRYANLSPGSYELVYRSVNSNGAWSNPARLQIIITAPFWKTTWFYLLLIGVLIGVVIMITRSIAQQKFLKQIAALERANELENERQRIGREMHDDIGAGLTQITLMSEAAKRTAMPIDQLNEIGVTSRQLVSSISEIIWSMNAENNSLKHLLSYMREQLHKLMEHAGIPFIIEFSVPANNYILSNEQRRNILLATKEIVHNAVKHSQASSIKIKAEIENEFLQISIEDDGVGFNVNKEHSGNGIRNIKKRTAAIGAELQVQAMPAKGSKFVFSLLLKSH